MQLPELMQAGVAPVAAEPQPGRGQRAVGYPDDPSGGLSPQGGGEMALLNQLPARYRAAYRRAFNEFATISSVQMARGEARLAAISDEEWNKAVAADNASGLSPQGGNGQGRKGTSCC
jgi:hypothetical protein